MPNDNKRQFTVRMQEETFEKIRYLAYVDRRSMTMEVEHALVKFIADYEREHGEIFITSAE